MAKDYFQDILLSNDNKVGTPLGADKKTSGGSDGIPDVGGRSIRNITVNPRAPRTRSMSSDVRGSASSDPQSPSVWPNTYKRSRVWIWVIVAISLIILTVLALFAFRSTKITITPRSRPIVFDQSVHFIANPMANENSGLSYTIVVNELEDTAVVASSGSEHAEERASGTVVVFNSYSTSPVRLIKNTRFMTPGGLVFRVPASVVIPGKKGSTPGSVQVTIAADQAGEQYNIGPVDKFTLPGLKTSPDMYADIYARSTVSFTGGFVGDKPAVAPGAIDAAKAEIRTRLETKVRDSAQSLINENAIVFLDLIRITYESLPSTTEAGGGIRVHEKARVEIPVFPPDAFAKN